MEKGDREKMLEVVTEVDRRPLSSFGCDGVIMATPTGSTAYAFSAGGPVVWPEVEALLMVPLSPHALFSRPLVVSPSSMTAVEVLTRTDARGEATLEVPAGAHLLRGWHPAMGEAGLPAEAALQVGGGALRAALRLPVGG